MKEFILSTYTYLVISATLAAPVIFAIFKALSISAASASLAI